VLAFADGDPIAQAIVHHHERLHRRAPARAEPHDNRPAQPRHAAMAASTGGSSERAHSPRRGSAPPMQAMAADSIQPRAAAGLTLEQLGVAARSKARSRAS
jgi:hypothetical protein